MTSVKIVFVFHGGILVFFLNCFKAEKMTEGSCFYYQCCQADFSY